MKMAGNKAFQFVCFVILCPWISAQYRNNEGVEWSSWSDGGTGAEVRVNQGIAVSKVDNHRDNYNQKTQGNKGQTDTGDWARSGTSRKIDPKSKQILDLLMQRYLSGQYKRKVAQHNTKSYLQKYDRYYWVGNRYYRLDVEAQRESRITCFYNMPDDIFVYYEDNARVHQIYFQCKKYFETCCALDCCKTNKGDPSNVATQTSASISLIFIVVNLVLSIRRLTHILDS